MWSRVGWIMTVVMLGGAIVLFGQESPYRDLESRSIKALSVEEIEQLLQGSGMGLALAAELNRYPGPKHVLDLSDRLELTQEQRRRTTEIHDEMLRDARRLGKAIVDWERTLNDQFATGRISEDELGLALDQIAEFNARLRFVHLSAHLKMRSILTAAQIERYVRLRGYGDAGSVHDPSRHHGR